MMPVPPDKSLVLFDGYCHLCSNSVRFILKYDRKKKFVFSPLSGNLSSALKKKLNIPTDIDSIILIENNEFFTRSKAVLKIANQLGGIFKLALVFKILPVNWLDYLYNWIGGKRLKWFGEKSSCMMPKPEHQDRFL